MAVRIVGAAVVGITPPSRRLHSASAASQQTSSKLPAPFGPVRRSGTVDALRRIETGAVVAQRALPAQLAPRDRVVGIAADVPYPAVPHRDQHAAGVVAIRGQVVRMTRSIGVSSHTGAGAVGHVNVVSAASDSPT